MFLSNALTAFVNIFSKQCWRKLQKVVKIFPSADLIASMYSPSARSCTAQSTFLLRPTMFSCHSFTVLDDLHPPVLRPCTVILNGEWTVHGLLVWGRLGNVRGFAGFTLCASLRSHMDHPPTFNDRPPSRKLTERSLGAPPRAFQICQTLSTTLCVPQRAPTT